MHLFRKKIKSEIINSPCKGKMIDIKDVNDPMFSQKMLGDGVAFILEDGLICSPVDGIVTASFPSKHAIGITSANDVEILVHIGINTADFNGNGFKSFVNEHQFVNKNDPLIKIDLDFFKSKEVDTTTILIITNSQKFTIERLSDYVRVNYQTTVLKANSK